MPRVIKVLTPENVELTFLLASPLDRALALIVDSLLQFALMVLLTVVGYLVLGQRADQLSWPLVIAGAAALSTFLNVAYNVAFEVMWNGRTPGKRLLRLRVIRDQGFPIDFRTSVVRNVVRLLDALPLNYTVGVLSVLLSKNFKRVGDFAAGTIVVREGAAVSPEEVPMPPPIEAGELELVALTPAALANIVRLHREHYLMLRHFLERVPALTPDQRLHYARRIGTAIMRLLGQPEPQPNEPFHYERFLLEVVWAYERRVRMGTPV